MNLIAHGRFVTFEGGEGAGKSTQAKLLAERLRAAGQNPILTREPGGSPGAEQIRKLLVEGEPDRWPPLAETLLFLAARADHVARVIEPALTTGNWVICDRFIDSTVVYQGTARGVGAARVRALQAAAGALEPDLTFILDVEPDAGLKRTTGRSKSEDRFEQFDREFHRQLRAAFLEIARNEPKRCAVVDGSRSVESVAAEIWRIVTERLA